MKVRWSRQSREHLVDIREYIRQHNVAAAVRLLRALPRLGHTGRKQGTREFVIRRLPYIIVYDITDGGELVILGSSMALRINETFDVRRILRRVGQAEKGGPLSEHFCRSASGPRGKRAKTRRMHGSKMRTRIALAPRL
jgi:plasmid stabilization system protein ParE